MSRSGRTILSVFIFLSGLGTFVFALLSLLGIIEGLWQSGLCLTIYIGLCLADRHLSQKTRK